KLGLIRDLLALRARHPEAFGPGAAYVALPADPGTVAFRRGDAVEVRVRVHPGSGTGSGTGTGAVLELRER
ncbi:MAG TPA: hypothetical protein VFN48_07770, partial [Solirubrobacteraceae bacterium]|nr:hypothetical protein [Solirubrobacteraceae bacterium]